MAVTAATITSLTLVGRAVTIAGTADRDGGGTDNTLTFLAVDASSNEVLLTSVFGESTLNASGPAATGVVFSFTGVLPENTYGVVRCYRLGAPSVLLATSATSVGIVQLRRPLPGVWTPRRDSRGLFVAAPRMGYQPTIGTVGTPIRHYNYAVAGSNGIYTSVHDRVIRQTEESFPTNLLRSVNTPYGVGIDAKPTWQFGAYPTQGGGWNVSRQTWVSLFYIYDSSKYVGVYPRFFGGVGNNPSIRGQSICWLNSFGQQALVVTSDTGYSGGEVSVNGIGNGLHCMVVTSIASASPTGVRIFLDGQFVATATAPNGWNGGTFPTTDFYGASVSQSGSNIGNILFNAILYGYVASDDEAQQLSLDPYRYFFVDAPTVRNRIGRKLNFESNVYQYSRPSADASNSGWVRVP